MRAGARVGPGPVLRRQDGAGLRLPLLAYLVLRDGGHHLLLWLVSAAAAGYYAPDIWLKRCLARRQRELFETFPDALDLMTVCVEAGLAMDAALARVAQEIGLKSAILAEELQLVTLELRAGSGKEKALRNLALRTGIDDVDALVTLLIQAERFGTSIGASLRVQSDQLRTKRRQRAEKRRPDRPQAAVPADLLYLPLADGGADGAGGAADLPRAAAGHAGLVRLISRCAGWPKPGA